MNSMRDVCLYGSVVNMKDSEHRQESSSDSGQEIRTSPAPREKVQFRRRSRTRTQVICDECEIQTSVAEYYCQDCDLVYCSNCNTHRHRKGKLVEHRRSLLPVSSPSQNKNERRGSSNLSREGNPNGIKVSPKTKAIANWTISDVIQWLCGIGLEQHIETIQSNHITGSILLAIENEDALEKRLGIKMRVVRKKLLREIQKLKSEKQAITMRTTRTPFPDLTVDVESPKLNANSPYRSSPVSARNSRLIHGKTESTGVGRVVRRGSTRLASPYSTSPSTHSVGSVSSIEEEEVNNTPETRMNSFTDRSASTSNRFNLQISDDAIRGTKKPHIEQNESRPLKLSPNPSGGVRMTNRIGALALDLDKVSTDRNAVAASFNFSAEGTLQTQGFEINTEGIASTPFQARNCQQMSLGTKDSLIMLKELGQGAGGKVYKALHMPTFNLVAVKVVRLYDQKKRHQMVRELKSLYENSASMRGQGNMNDKKICKELVTFHDAFTNPDKGTVSIVLEYMDAGSLEDMVQSGKKCTEESLVNIAYGVLMGLKYLHDRHQLHRDIKPSNILLNRRGEAKISDFGISRDLESTLAKATTFTGTLMYMAPERISGGTYSYPSDIWSFGLSLMTCAIGRVPLPVNDGYWGVVHAVQQKPSPKLTEFGDFSPELSDFLDQCLRKDPMKRPSCCELLEHDFLKKYKQVVMESPKLRKSMTPEEYDEIEEIASKVQVWDNTIGRSLPSEICLISRKERLKQLSKQLCISESIISSYVSI